MNDCRLECVGTFDVRASEHSGPAPRAELGALARTTPPDMSVEVNDATAEVTERIHIEVEQQVLACMARMEAHLRRRRKELEPAGTSGDRATPREPKVGQFNGKHENWAAFFDLFRVEVDSKNWFQSSHS